MNKTNWGIIATGSIAAKLAEAINSNENSVLYAVASRSENKAKDFAEKFGAIKHYSSYEEFEKDNGYKAYKFKNTLELPVEDIMAVKSNSGFSLYATFILNDGNRICIYQHWQITSEYFGSVSDCEQEWTHKLSDGCLLYTSPSPRD